MTSQESTPLAPPDRSATPRRARLPIVAIVVGLVPCCPASGLLGALLGVIALRRASRAVPPNVGDRRLALAAIVIGAVSSIAWSVALDRFAAHQRAAADEQMVAAVTRLLGAVDGSAVAEEASRAWAGTLRERPAPAAIESIAAEARSRWGRLRSADVVSSATLGPLLSPYSEAALVLHFDHGSIVGSARFRHVVAPRGLIPEVLLEEIVIEDRVRGDLVLGLAGGGSGRDAAGAGRAQGARGK